MTWISVLKKLNKRLTFKCVNTFIQTIQKDKSKERAGSVLLGFF